MRNGVNPAPAILADKPADPVTPAATRRSRQGRLFRKYLLLILTLVSGALLASGAISVYFSYQEHKSALGSLQQEKAIAAASRIEQYIRQIQQQLAYAALQSIGQLHKRGALPIPHKLRDSQQFRANFS